MPATPEEIAVAEFSRTFGASATAIARAPARVELLGNHTDYNGGLVLAAAIDRVTVIAGRATLGRAAWVRSAYFDQLDSFNVDTVHPEAGASDTWGRYVQGVVWALRLANGPIASGFDATMAGDVPIGLPHSPRMNIMRVRLFLPRRKHTLLDRKARGMNNILKRTVPALAALALLSSYSVSPASAAGCLKGAAVGGVAGHVAGHGVLGAAAGCAVGHHEAGKKAKAAQQSAIRPPRPARATPMAARPRSSSRGRPTTFTCACAPAPGA